MRKLLIFFALFSVSLAHASFADQLKYGKAYLARLGIDLSRFKMAGFSGDGRTAVGIERVNSLALRAKGFVWVLRDFKLDPYGRLLSSSATLLPISDLENVAVDQTGKIAVVIAQYGTELVEVNLLRNKAKIVFTHEEGKPGFRTRQWITCHDGNFYTEGYYYDPEGYWVSDSVVLLDLTHPESVALFHKMWDIGKTRSALGTMRSEWIVSGTEGYLAAQNSKDVTLLAYDDGKITTVDSAAAFGGFAGNSHRILYSALYDDGSRKTVLKDLQSGKSWILGEEKPYLYPYLSRDGKTAVVALIDFQNGRISFFCATEADDFSLKPVPDLQDVQLGTFRLAPNGKEYSFQDATGITIGTLP